MKLEDFIKQTNSTLVQVAAELGVSDVTVGFWIKRTKIPSPENMKKIHEWSNGSVTPNDFHDISAEEQPAT